MPSGIVTVQTCRRCANEACAVYSFVHKQAENKADVVRLNGYA